MHKTTKRFVAKTGVAVGVGVGSLLGARSMEADNPHRADVEWVGQAALLGSAIAVARRGIVAFAMSNFEKDATRDEARIKELKLKLPEIETIRNPYNFFRHLQAHEPEHVDNPTTKYLLGPVLRAFGHSSSIDPFKYESLTWTVDAMRDRMKVALESDEHESDIIEVIEAAWFLDQTFPIAMSDLTTPEARQGEKHWYDYIQHSIPYDEAIA